MRVKRLAPVDQLFADISDYGCGIRYVTYARSGEGMRLRVQGQIYTVDIEQDSHRADVLLVVDVGTTDDMTMDCGAEPLYHSAQFQLLGPGQTPENDLDSVAALFHDESSPTCPSRPPSPAVTTVVPGPTIQRCLRDASEELRELFRRALAQSEPDATWSLEPFRQIWKRHQLDTYVALGTSESVLSMLRGHKAVLLDGNRESIVLQELRSAFDFNLLNRFASRNRNNRAAIDRLLFNVASLPLTPYVKATIWSETLAGLDGNGLRRELLLAAPTLKQVAQTKHATTYAAAILRTLRSMADRAPAHSAATEALDFVDEHSAGDTVAALADWGLQTRIGSPSQPPAPGSASSAHSANLHGDDNPDSTTHAPALRVASSQRAIVDRWVLSMTFPGANEVDLLRREMAEAARDFSQSVPTEASVEAYAKCAETLDNLATRIAKWRREIPAPNEMRERRVRGEEAYLRARNLAGDVVDEFLLTISTTETLLEVAHLLQSHESLAKMPPWFWCDEEYR
ncbi:MAG: hypothetical protein U1E22_05520, partial [Coriobacteriia bacterium]|nr:hypothetical protein [Coriobacteriia bacterium]